MTVFAHKRCTELLHVLPAIPRECDEPVFVEPWHAEVFAMVVSLHEKGLFTWSEWADLLGQQISQAPQSDVAGLETAYYQHWLVALERLLVLKHIGTEAQLADLYRRWDGAAQATPHGQPIEL